MSEKNLVPEILGQIGPKMSPRLGLSDFIQNKIITCGWNKYRLITNMFFKVSGRNLVRPDILGQIWAKMTPRLAGLSDFTPNKVLTGARKVCRMITNMLF